MVGPSTGPARGRGGVQRAGALPQLATARAIRAKAAPVSGGSLVRRLRKLEARRKPADLRVRCVWWDAGEPEPLAQPGERLIICSWGDHPEPRDAGAEPVSAGA
jgi:hypothetical protein